MERCSEGHESFHFSFLVIGIEVQVMSILLQMSLVGLVQGDVGPSPPGIFQDDPATLRRPRRHIMEGLLPKVHHAGEIVTVNHDGADSNSASCHGDALRTSTVKHPIAIMRWKPRRGDAEGEIRTPEGLAAHQISSLARLTGLRYLSGLASPEPGNTFSPPSRDDRNGATSNSKATTGWTSV